MSMGADMASVPSNVKGTACAAPLVDRSAVSSSMRNEPILRHVLGAILALTATPLAAQSTARRSELPAAYSAIREADLRRDVSEMAGPAMRGREGGTLDEMRASMWIAEQYRRVGLRPMGEDGTWFQWFYMT